MTATTAADVGAFVAGDLDGRRELVRHAATFAAWCALDGRVDPDRPAYLSTFAAGPDLIAHARARSGSTRDYGGPVGADRVWFDIDRPDLDAALTDARKLAGAVLQRYPDLDGRLLFAFSGRKGFHAGLPLGHAPPPSPQFHRQCRALAEALAGAAGVAIDPAVYSRLQPLRLFNTRHPRSGLYKRRLDLDELLRLGAGRIRDLARHPADFDPPPLGLSVPALADDWEAAGRALDRRERERSTLRRDVQADPGRAPRYLLEFLRFGVPEGERHVTLFRCAAWLTEAGCPPPAVFALLREPAADLGLAPADADRQIRCGIDHAERQRALAAGGPPS